MSSRSNFAFSKKHPLTDDYEIFEQLGSGAFSTVHRAEHKVSGEEVAVKTMKKGAIAIKELRREVYIMREVSGHENIIALLDIYEEEKQIHLVLELVTGGELFDKLVEMEYYSESDAAKLIHQLINIVKFLHTKNIVHRDLKPENMLFVDPSAETIKLCDFGLADYMGKNVGLSGVVGSRTYMAPEILKMKTYGKPVDMYSIGVIMYILLCGYPPFEPERGITELEFPSPDWDKISDTAKKLIANLLAPDPSKRLTAEQASAHRWILGETAPQKPLTGSLRTLKKFNTHRKSGTTMEREKSNNKLSVFSVFEGISGDDKDNKEDESTKSTKQVHPPEESTAEDSSGKRERRRQTQSTDTTAKEDPRERRRKDRKDRKEGNLVSSAPSSGNADDDSRISKLETELRHSKALIEVLKREVDLLKKLLQEDEEYNAESRRKIKEDLWKIQKDNQEERRKRTKLGRSVALLEERFDAVEKKLGLAPDKH
eukprot:TRINITY_DN8915_c0_g1_i3.p1 TRINITY_DN8915_c0_g1~~TRINITY_DN8915_c0_g1_i3.p1  ORF type:complete len:485 (-),score=102.19 TRINITY_DN8915_c0_g1_i3:34-1488(-)